MDTRPYLTKAYIVANIAAERIWHTISPNGDSSPLILRVGLPKPYPAGEWGCEVSLGVLESTPTLIYGVDAWQAIELSMLYTARRVADFAKEGWQFFWELDGEAARASELAHDPAANI
ncbi:DUF6968 family protein [Chitinimonas sp. BJB300]|uniref:DUF6968 family protein n=1 Tax=Chitinimonas sp. BJB300 TaxID=1559339 RepID=UPI000C121D65|nr:hypothetical protein [Chitinimonas sp. BJB300]PHV12434.1 hypothetical protein CSQ89_05590 [Chitinimonas sp. BJB300]TSJ88556.1 hypothetical protein FG002_010335 [Chitinimonas sp. BJB300]